MTMDIKWSMSSMEDFDIENFEELYQGQYESGAELLRTCKDCGYIIESPSWVEVDWLKTWDGSISYDYIEIGYPEYIQCQLLRHINTKDHIAKLGIIDVYQ